MKRPTLLAGLLPIAILQAATPFAGSWKAELPEHERWRREGTVIFEPLAQDEGLRMSDGAGPVFAASFEGGLSPYLKEEGIAVRIGKEGDRRYTLRFTRDGELRYAKDIEIDEESKTMLIRASTVLPDGQYQNDIQQ